MSAENRRRMRHVQIDVGEGVTAMVRLRGPMTPELAEAFAEIAKAALDHAPASVRGVPPTHERNKP